MPYSNSCFKFILVYIPLVGHRIEYIHDSIQSVEGGGGGHRVCLSLGCEQLKHSHFSLSMNFSLKGAKCCANIYDVSIVRTKLPSKEAM